MEYSHLPAISCFYSEDSRLHSYINPNNPSLAESEAHFEYELVLVTAGSGRVTINNMEYAFQRKSLIIISRLERHHFVVEHEPYCRFVASMSSDLILSNIKDVELTSLFIQRPKGFCHVIELCDEAYRKLRPLFVRMTNEYTRKDAFYVSRSASLVVAILIDLYRSHPEAFPMRSHANISSAVVSAQRYINDHYYERVTLQDIARENYVSAHALSLAFKDIVGTTFKEYLILFRLTEAKKLLITTDLSVEDVATQVGYINVNNFIQMFRREEGITPLQYRKKFSSSM